MASGVRCLLLGLVLSLAGASFLDTEQPILFQNGDHSFGHQVVQLGRRVIVSAPRQQEVTNKTGRIYGCDPGTTRCSPIPITGSEDDINISLGISLAASEDPGRLLACGPTLQRTCSLTQNIYVNGRCYQLDQNLIVRGNLSAPPPVCGPDVVFVIDGSGSVQQAPFRTMLQFVRRIISSFSSTDTQFALLQYSATFKVEFNFRRFLSDSDLDLVTRISYQRGGATRTATAMLKAIEDLFIPLSRTDATKLLIVITDGQSYLDDLTIDSVTQKAKQLGIQRISIGVGDFFSRGDALKELQSIASSADNVFQVNDFSALEKIQQSLQQKIFAIEGTQTLSGQSFQMEFSQEGFSSVLTSNGAFLGAVGAYGWTGGAYNYVAGNELEASWVNMTQDHTDMKDSYMGYSLAEVRPDVIAMGAPRYQHAGRVIVFRRDSRSLEWIAIAHVLGDQIGSYFGSALKVVKISASKPLLVVGAPTYYSPAGPGGRVYLCPISAQEMRPRKTITTMACPETLQGDSSQSMGHFGSAITVMSDLTADQYPDLVIGAPLEENGQGALYVFPGKDGGFRTSYIQRIVGRVLSAGVQLFGRSLAANLDMTDDGLPDVTVGGRGVAVILRSRPVLQVSLFFRFSPSQFSLSSYECTDSFQPQTTDVQVCFIKTERSPGARAGTSATVNYTLVLDAGRTQHRAVFSDPPQPDPRMTSSSLVLRSNQDCVRYTISLPECVEDSLTPLRISLNYSLIGNPVLSEDSRTSRSAEISFEKNCGADGVCQDDLGMNLSFSSLQLVVGLSLDVNLTVSVTNKGEESYNARVLIPFPRDLSYRRVSLLQSNKRVTVTCATEEEQRVATCGVNRPLLRPNTTAVFLVSFHVAQKATLGLSLTMTANVTSDNKRDEVKTSSSTIKVLYSIYVTITSLEESSKYENFTSPLASVRHVYRVENLGVHPLPLNVTFLIPVRLGESTIWEAPNITSSEPQLATCTTVNETERPAKTRELLKESPVLNCSVGTCLRIVCHISNLTEKESVNFTISGSVSKDWETQTEQKKIFLQSSAEIQYNTQMYIMEQNFTKAQAQTVLEVIVQYNYLPVIIGSSVGGLVLLALITAGLYKLGFFKRQYKEMLQTTEGETTGDNAALDSPSKGGPE